MSVYYRDSVPESFRLVLDASLNLIRCAIPDETGWDSDRAAQLQAAWRQIEEQNRRVFHSGITEAICTLRQLLGELSGTEELYTAEMAFIYMVWCMEEAFPEYAALGFTSRGLTRVYAEPSSVLGWHMLKLVQLCDVLDGYVETGMDVDPEQIAITVYGDLAYQLGCELT